MDDKQVATLVPEIKTIQPQPVDDENYFTAYTNGVGIAHTFFDFQLHFSEIKVYGPERITAEMFATLTMSPQLAKVFYKHLTQNLEAYEAKFGEIKVPEGLLEVKTENIDLRSEQGDAI